MQVLHVHKCAACRSEDALTVASAPHPLLERPYIEPALYWFTIASPVAA